MHNQSKSPKYKILQHKRLHKQFCTKNTQHLFTLLFFDQFINYKLKNFYFELCFLSLSLYLIKLNIKVKNKSNYYNFAYFLFTKTIT